KTAGMRTAWSDKHPSYDIVQGPVALGPYPSVDDLYTPEIAANVGLTAGGGITDDPLQSVTGLSSTNTSVKLTEAYDELKVKAILNEIAGLDHTGTNQVGIPAIFGMNFQSVSVGQKLAKDFLMGDQRGGYVDAAGTPTAVLQDGLDYVDGALGRMLAKLNSEGIMD